MQDRGLAERWWVYDRPLLRDPMFVVAVVLGMVRALGVLLDRDRYGAGAFLLTILLAVPAAIAGIGIVGGIGREFVRGRRRGS